MVKPTGSLFVCVNCGNEFTKWQGQCSYCDEWNSLKEVNNRISVAGRRKERKGGPLGHHRGGKTASQPLQLSEIQSQILTRFSTGFDELDRVFGSAEHNFDHKDTKSSSEKESCFAGGIVPGSVTLLSGEPGMGKSTLLSQLALNLVQKNPKSEYRNTKQIQNSKQKINIKFKTQNSENGNIPSQEELSASLRRGVLYICGEESPEQVKLRLERLTLSFRPSDDPPPCPSGRGGEEKKSINKTKMTEISPPVPRWPSGSQGRNDHLFLLPETNVEAIVGHLIKHPDDYRLVIIDSIQSLISDQLPGFAGSISQVRECGFQLTQVLKQTGTAGIIVGHVTKDGSLAGPKTLEHMVDAVFHLEGERTHDLRLVRSLKNRFGATDEVGVFRMTGEGLIEVPNPGDVFLENSQQGQPGSITTAVLEGNRVMLLEIQALVLSSSIPVPRRVVNGVRLRRLQMVLAVLQKQLNLRLGEMDVFINVAGGVHIDEPAADLAMALAIITSLKNKSLGVSEVYPFSKSAEASAESRRNNSPKKQIAHPPIVFGELGLLGEIRPVIGVDKRQQTARKLGYSTFIGVGERHIREIRI